MHVLQICCFNRHSNLQSRINSGYNGAELHHTTLLQCLAGAVTRPPALRAPPHQPQADIAVWSGRLTRQTHPHWTFSLRVMLRLKRTHVREPLTVIEFKIAIASWNRRDLHRSVPPHSGPLPKHFRLFVVFYTFL